MVLIDPHAKISSAEQTLWVELVEGMRNQLYRIAMDPNLDIETIRALRLACWEVKTLHTTCLLFDTELEAQRDKLQG